ncbi:hypothetical protein P152DRAFT_455955 [Eremomyces bilateralis CBS 781.70]|uniref:DUF7136 domain-containing protein n=1 Tax=Eremomyces bilateralis CBS 781.70 TaxID=1392243 RepID=A0A6G1GAH7_9PEZI|nr:uncharacterized protein P152DRAFT_455955 [Eremomyces bilateralis CBS 781.70]KAF1814911.1 hypothetical protein P152DRAFT_455955 [Eremomyces bilateralis CBS 781.70]
MRLRVSVALIALGLAAPAAGELDLPAFPTDINVGVVFPRNETYNLDLATIPAVFAIQGAYAAFRFGHTIRWEFSGINKTGGTQSLYEAGYMLRLEPTEPPVLPPDAIGDNWIVGNTSYINSTSKRKPGHYRLTWELIMSRCTAPGPKAITIHSGAVAEGSIDFTITDEGPETEIDLTSACPVYSDGVTITSSNLGCPFMSKKDGKDLDLCELKPDKTLADCVMTNITQREDRSACEALLERVRGEAGSRPSGVSGDAASVFLQHGLTAATVGAVVVGFMLL